MNQYDVIVIGCNVSSLISALSLLNDGYKVLLVDNRNTIGEINGITKLGRYTFYNNFNNLYLNNGMSNYSLNRILDICGIKERLDYVTLDNLCNIKINDKEYILPLGIDNFTNYLEELLPGSKSKLDTLFKVALECRDGLDYIVSNVGKTNFDYVKKEYSNFYNLCYLSLEEGLNKISIDGDLKEILSRLCIYYGTDINNMSYVEYLVFLVNIVEYGVQFIKGDLLNLLLNEYIKKNGYIRLKSNVVNLIIDDEIVNGIRLSTGEVIYSNKVVVSEDIKNVYGNMIEAKDVPRRALKHINKRVSGNKVFSIYLGLNIDLKDSINSNNYIFNNMIVNIDTSDEVSTISIQYILKDNVFIESVNTRNYYLTMERKVKKILDELENNMSIKIFDNIEEIKVVSPFNQEVFDIKLNIDEGIVSKILNSNNERYIKGLCVCSGLNGDIYGYRSNLVSGIEVFNYYKNEGDLSEKI